MGAILDKIVALDMVGSFCSQPDAGSVVEPEPTFLWLPIRHFQPLPPPDPLHSLVVDHPAGGRAQELCDLAIAVAAVLASKRDNIGGEPLLIVSPSWNTPLRRAMLPKHAADPPLG
jgi:hypothetical protein